MCIDVITHCSFIKRKSIGFYFSGRRRKDRRNFDKEKSQNEKEQGSEKEDIEGRTAGKEENNLTNIPNSNNSLVKTSNITDFPRGISERNTHKNKNRKKTGKDETNSKILTVTVDVEEEKHQSKEGSKVHDYSGKDKTARRKGENVNTRENNKLTKKKEKMKKKPNRNSKQSSKAVDSQLPEYSKQNDVIEPDVKNNQTSQNDIRNGENVESYSNNNEEKNNESIGRHSPLNVNVNKESQGVSVNESNAEGVDNTGNADSISNKTKKEENKSETTNDPSKDTTSDDVNKPYQEDVKLREEKYTSDNEDVKSEISRDNVNTTHTSGRFSPQRSDDEIGDVTEPSSVDSKQTPKLKTSESNENIDINQEKEQEQFLPRNDNVPNSVEGKSDPLLDRNIPKNYTETDAQNDETLDNSPSLNNTSVDDDNDDDDVNRFTAYQNEDINDVQERDKERKSKDTSDDTDKNEIELEAGNLTNDIDVIDAAKSDNGRSGGNLSDKTIVKDSSSENVITNAEQQTEETFTAAEVIDSDSNVARDANIENDASKHPDNDVVTDTDAINNSANILMDEEVDTKIVDDGKLSHQTDGDLDTDISEDTKIISGDDNSNTAVIGDIQHANDLRDVIADNVNSNKAKRDSLEGNNVRSHFNSADGVENETNDKESDFNDSSRNTRNDEYNEGSSNEIPNNVPPNPITDSNKEISDVSAVNISNNFRESMDSTQAEAGHPDNTLINANSGQNNQPKEQKNISNGESVDNFIDDRYRTYSHSSDNGNRLEDNLPAMTSFVENNDRKSDENSKMDESDNILNAVVENTEKDRVAYNNDGSFQNENVGGNEILSDTAQDKVETPDTLDNSNGILGIADTEDNIQNINENETTPHENNAIRSNKTNELDNMISDRERLVVADSKTKDQHSSSDVEERDKDDDNDYHSDVHSNRGGGDAADDGDGKGGDIIEGSRETISLTSENNETNDDVNITEDGLGEPDVGGSIEVKLSNGKDMQNTRTNSESTIKDGIYSNGSPTLPQSATEHSEAEGSNVTVEETTAEHTDDNTIKSHNSGDAGGNNFSREVSMSIDEDGDVNKVTGNATLYSDVNRDAVVEKNATADNVSDDESDVIEKAAASVRIISNATTDDAVNKTQLGVTEFSTVDEDYTSATSDVTESNPVDGDTNLFISGVAETTPGDEDVNNDVMKATDSHNVDSDDADVDKRVTESNAEHNSDNDKSEDMNSTTKDEDVNLVSLMITDRDNGDGEINVSTEKVEQNAKEFSDVDNAAEDEGSINDDKNIS